MARMCSLQDEIQNSQIQVYPCITPLPRENASQLDFTIDRTDSLVDLARSYLTVEVQILNKDGTEIDDVVAPAVSYTHLTLPTTSRV